MKHFADEEWVDFTRNVLPQEKHTALQKHLNEGCEPCTQAWKIWSQVSHTAKQMGSEEPPSKVVKEAKSLFHATWPKTELAQSLGAMIGQLVFDSYTQPALAGVRNMGLSSRQLLFRRGTLYVDVRLEFDDSARFIRIIGQLQNPGTESAPTSIYRVALLSAGRVVVTANSNINGEFYLVASRGNDHQLLIVNIDDKDQTLRLDLPADPVVA